VVEQHDGPGGFQSIGTERRSHQVERGLTLDIRHLAQAHALPLIGIDVAPESPLIIIDWEEGNSTLLIGQRGQEGLTG
jgi:hypothetical protein